MRGTWVLLPSRFVGSPLPQLRALCVPSVLRAVHPHTPHHDPGQGEDGGDAPPTPCQRDQVGRGGAGVGQVWREYLGCLGEWAMKYTGQKWGHSGHGSCRRALRELGQGRLAGTWQLRGAGGVHCVLGMSGKARGARSRSTAMCWAGLGRARSDGARSCWVWGDRLHCAVRPGSRGVSGLPCGSVVPGRMLSVPGRGQRSRDESGSRVPGGFRGPRWFRGSRIDSGVPDGFGSPGRVRESRAGSGVPGGAR